MHLYRWQDRDPLVSVYSDSNWAGCLKTRKSTSGACIYHGEHLIRSYAKTQSLISLSSAEAELYATTMAASEALGVKSMMADFGLACTPHLFVDASAAIGICQRKGLGKVRHLDTQSLWIQDALRDKRMDLGKVKGTENPSDAMTKFLDGVSLTKMLSLLNCVFLEGRASSTPALAKDAAHPGEVRVDSTHAFSAPAPPLSSPGAPAHRPPWPRAAAHSPAAPSTKLAKWLIASSTEARQQVAAWLVGTEAASAAPAAAATAGASAAAEAAGRRPRKVARKVVGGCKESVLAWRRWQSEPDEKTRIVWADEC